MFILNNKQYRALKIVSKLPAWRNTRPRVHRDLRVELFPDDYRGKATRELQPIVKKLLNKGFLQHSQLDGKLMLSITDTGIAYLEAHREPKSFIEDEYTR